MKRFCDGCRAYTGEGCLLGYKTLTKFKKVWNTWIHYEVPLEQCPKPRTWQHYDDCKSEMRRRIK